jgi:hypothetical protein
MRSPGETARTPRSALGATQSGAPSLRKSLQKPAFSSGTLSAVTVLERRVLQAAAVLLRECAREDRCDVTMDDERACLR